MVALMGGVKMIHVPYKGTGPATIDLLSGQITWMVGTILPSMPHIKSGRLRALAVTGAQRVPVLPEVPTAAETLPGFEANSWYGVSVQGATPKDVIAKLKQPRPGIFLERVMGIEPTYLAWEANVLPLNYTRADRHCMGAATPLATGTRNWRVSEFARINNLTDRRYIGSVIVAEANNRFYEPAPERNFLLGVTAELKF